ncbi:MAG: hypothetical protein WCX61_02420 [Candidatus Peribacteraceae bacterium]
MSALNRIPSNIPDSKEKKRELDAAGKESIYLGQGLIFRPPEAALADYNAYLIAKGLQPEDYPLKATQVIGQAGDVYNSATLDETWESIEADQRSSGHRKPEAFGGFAQEKSARTIANLYEIDETGIATTQVDNLMQSLECVQMAIPQLTGGQPLSRVILPQQHAYSGHKEFVAKLQTMGLDFEALEISAVQIDGSQDIASMKEAFELVKSEGRVALLIDQPHNNNASGFDRDLKYNQAISALLKEYAGIVFYFGDNAYKGLKEPLHGAYPLMQQLINDDVMAFHNTSFSKIGNYRGTPSYKSILCATAGKIANTNTLQVALNRTQRGRGIGATADGAILMHELVQKPGFVTEVAVLNEYLQFIRDSIAAGLAGTDLADLFGEQTSGIFRCVPPTIAQKLNSGDRQAITVENRINIWPLGVKETREFFLDLLS